MAQQTSITGERPEGEAPLVNIPRLVTAYYSERPDPGNPGQRVAFGTSGHRGSAFKGSFNEWHILAIAQAICRYRKKNRIDGPLFLGIDTHALSAPAFASALEVLAANGVELMIAPDGEYTPTPAISHAILVYNRGRTSGLADGIVITPSHNPPEDGGFKYNPTHGGPADTDVTRWIQDEANSLLETGLREVKRIPLQQAVRASTTHIHDYTGAYMDDLDSVIDMDAIRGSSVRLGIDPLGGAGVRYWERTAERYGLNLDVLREEVDPTFRFMAVDWDGKIRMDPSSPYVMQPLISMISSADRFDLLFACDTDHDRHAIVTGEAGLIPPNQYLTAAMYYLFSNRPMWPQAAAVGKTVVSSAMIDKVAAKLGRSVYEVPVGFKWFVAGLLDGSLGFCGEESAGASFLRRDGSVWTTDKDGIIPCLLAAEMTAKTGKKPDAIYRDLAGKLGDPIYERTDVPATPAQKAALSNLPAELAQIAQLAGEEVLQILTAAPGNEQAIGGLKVVAESGWFAARPSGTEEVYKIYAESFRSEEHLQGIQQEAQEMIRLAFESPAGDRQR